MNHKILYFTSLVINFLNDDISGLVSIEKLLVYLAEEKLK